MRPTCRLLSLTCLAAALLACGPFSSPTTAQPGKAQMRCPWTVQMQNQQQAQRMQQEQQRQLQQQQAQRQAQQQQQMLQQKQRMQAQVKPGAAQDVQRQMVQKGPPKILNIKPPPIVAQQQRVAMNKVVQQRQGGVGGRGVDRVMTRARNVVTQRIIQPPGQRVVVPGQNVVKTVTVKITAPVEAKRQVGANPNGVVAKKQAVVGGPVFAGGGDPKNKVVGGGNDPGLKMNFTCVACHQNKQPGRGGQGDHGNPRAVARQPQQPPRQGMLQPEPQRKGGPDMARAGGQPGPRLNNPPPPALRQNDPIRGNQPQRNFGPDFAMLIPKAGPGIVPQIGRAGTPAFDVPNPPPTTLVPVILTPPRLTGTSPAVTSPGSAEANRKGAAPPSYTEPPMPDMQPRTDLLLQTPVAKDPNRGKGSREAASEKPTADKSATIVLAGPGLPALPPSLLLLDTDRRAADDIEDGLRSASGRTLTQASGAELFRPALPTTQSRLLLQF